MRVSQVGWCALLCVLVTACGGGGGGGGGAGRDDNDNNNSLRFSLDRSSVSYDYDEGTTPPSQQVIATATGTYEGTLYVAAIVEGNGVDPNIQVTIGGVQGTFLLSAAPNLAPGNYTGRVLLLACSDQACNNRLGGTPLPVSYSVTVRAILRVAPTTVNMSAVSGNTATAQLTIQLPEGQTSHLTAVAAGGEWLSAATQSATSTILTARSMPSGTLHGTVAVTSGNRVINVPVNYTVSAPPGGDRNLSVSPSNLTLTAREGTVDEPVSLTVVPPSWDDAMTTEATVSYPGPSTPWLTVVPSADGYQVTASAANLRASTRTADILISGAAPAIPVTVPVSFTIGAGLAQPADVNLLIDSATTASSPVLSGSVPVTVTEGPVASWTAASDSSWLVLTRASGQTGTSINYAVDQASIPDLPNFRESVATVTVTPALAAIAPVTFAVRLTRQLAHITGLGPYFQLSDRDARIVVRGRGFISSRDWATHLRVAGAPAGNGNVTRVNDTELLVDLPPPPFATIVFEPTNALGISFGMDSLKVLQPRMYAETAIGTGFPVRSIEYDAERQQIYLVNAAPGAGALQRYVFSSGSWTTPPSAAIPAITDANLSSDGAQIRVTTATGVLRFYEPQTLNEGVPLDVPAGLGPITQGRNLATTNDRRVWLSIGPGPFNDLGYFDGLTGELTMVESPLTNFIGGPWFGVSRNGERLVISQSSNATPAPPMLYLDAADGVLRVAPFVQENGDAYFANAAMSDDASRMVLNNFRVRDHDFNQIGRVDVDQATEDNFLGLSTSVVVSSNGARAYVLAYEANEFVESTPQFVPRVYVFDISTPGPADQRMPLLGYFELSGYPTCLRFAECDVAPVATISHDGNTLFIAGSEFLFVVPIPSEGALTPATMSLPLNLKQSAPRTTRWDLDLRRGADS